MIISRTPFRVSFFGGGTDYPQWYLKEGGAVLSTTIDKYVYMTCRYLPPFFEVPHRIVWSRVETPARIVDIQHPAIREGLRMLGFNDGEGLDIHYQGDLPARSGMGSSSAFAVGLINALSALKGIDVGRHDLALKAIRLERDILKETVGGQDQVAAAYGGLNHIEFFQSGNITVNPVAISRPRLAELESSIMLFYSGISRYASAVAAETVANLDTKKDILHKMRRLVDEALAILAGSGPLSRFGELLHQSWLLKRELSTRISNEAINRAYAQACEAGALGGKLLGAGESGFMAFFVPPERRKIVLMALGDLLYVPCRFVEQGSKIIHRDGESMESVRES